MYSNGVGRTESTGPLDPKRVDQVKPADCQDSDKTDSTKAAPSPQDQASISVNAAEVARYREMAELHREAYGPEDRSGRLDEVKERIASGYYDKGDVIESIAGKVTDESVSTPAGASDMQVIRDRSESGFYERPEVVDKTAEKMVRSVLPGLEE